MPPPELSGDAPVLDVVHPVVVNLGPALREEAHFVRERARLGRSGGRPVHRTRARRAVGEGADGSGRGARAPFFVGLLHTRPRLVHAWIFQKPLFAQARLNRHVGALAVADIILMRLFLLQRAKFLQLFRRDLARFEAVQPDQVRAGQRVHRPVRVHDVDHRQLVALADFKVGFVMRGRHFEHAGPEFRIDMFIADDGNEFLFARQFGGQRPHNVLADELRVAFVLRVYGDGGVAGNRFRAGRCDGEPDAGRADLVIRRTGILPACIFIFFFFSLRQARRLSYDFDNFNFEIMEQPALSFHHDFFVRKRGERGRTPVHHPFATVNEALLVKLDEDLLDAA